MENTVKYYAIITLLIYNKFFACNEKINIFAALIERRDGRVVDCGGLENR